MWNGKFHIKYIIQKFHNYKWAKRTKFQIAVITVILNPRRYTGCIHDYAHSLFREDLESSAPHWLLCSLVDQKGFGIQCATLVIMLTRWSERITGYYAHSLIREDDWLLHESCIVACVTRWPWGMRILGNSWPRQTPIMPYTTPNVYVCRGVHMP